MIEKKSFVLFNDLSIPVESLPDEEAGKLFKAIFEYQNGGVKQELSSSAEMAFIFIKQQLDRNQEKYETICQRNRINGMKGGRPEKPKKPSGLIGNPKHPSEPKKPDNDNDTGIDNDIDTKKEEKTNYTKTDLIIDYFNKKTGKSMRCSKASREPISARLKEGFTVDDCKQVIDIKISCWVEDPEMQKFIRISTLFRPSHFETYLNEKVIKKKGAVNNRYVPEVVEITEEDRLESEKILSVGISNSLRFKRGRDAK